MKLSIYVFWLVIIAFIGCRMNDGQTDSRNVLIEEFTIDLNANGKADTIRLSNPPIDDPGVYGKLVITLSDGSIFEYQKPDAYDKIDSTVTFGMENMLASKNLFCFQHDKKSYLVLFGYHFASNPPVITIIEIAGNKATTIFDKNLDLYEIADLNGDGVPDMAAKTDYPMVFDRLEEDLSYFVGSFVPYEISNLDGSIMVDKQISNAYNKEHYIDVDVVESAVMIAYPNDGSRPYLIVDYRDFDAVILGKNIPLMDDYGEELMLLSSGDQVNIYDKGPEKYHQMDNDGSHCDGYTFYLYYVRTPTGHMGWVDGKYLFKKYSSTKQHKNFFGGEEFISAISDRDYTIGGHSYNFDMVMDVFEEDPEFDGPSGCDQIAIPFFYHPFKERLYFIKHSPDDFEFEDYLIDILTEEHHLFMVLNSEGGGVSLTSMDFDFDFDGDSGALILNFTHGYQDGGSYSRMWVTVEDDQFYVVDFKVITDEEL
ncbi:MAG: hypothetical protein IH946_10400 [Bacteroidetes bacterium]|nr:hypothetical protein [Bacteroidota bacterium]